MSYRLDIEGFAIDTKCFEERMMMRLYVCMYVCNLADMREYMFFGYVLVLLFVVEYGNGMVWYGKWLVVFGIYICDRREKEGMKNDDDDDDVRGTNVFCENALCFSRPRPGFALLYGFSITVLLLLLRISAFKCLRRGGRK
ncbi:hypothetical protein DM02DRAFT_142648 [Periconia macrospinosa]|uniref:Transmembrane protein n=1 Tax=Periconia macrospinosa TaxID=97972 RepID=A0A2V1E2V4_9PLEO|nr:hypothetical protein DM02DRAFT_142648 [Periconia macrospinosa]